MRQEPNWGCCRKEGKCCRKEGLEMALGMAEDHNDPLSDAEVPEKERRIAFT